MKKSTVYGCLAAAMLSVLFTAKECQAAECAESKAAKSAAEERYHAMGDTEKISARKAGEPESLDHPYYETHVYVAVPGESLDKVRECYYTKAFADAQGNNITSLLGAVYVGQETLNGVEVVHYRHTSHVSHCKYEGIPGQQEGYKDFVLQNDAHGVVIGGDLGWNFEDEFEAVPTDDWFTYKGTEPIYIRYAFKVAKTNGEIQPDGYTVKYAGWVGLRMDGAPNDEYERLWAVDQEGLSGGSVKANFKNGGYYNWDHFRSVVDEDDGERTYEWARFDVTSGYVTGIYGIMHRRNWSMNSVWGWHVDGNIEFKIEYASGKTERLKYYLDNAAPVIKKSSTKSSQEAVYEVEDENLKKVTVDGKAKKLKTGAESLFITLKTGTYVIEAWDKAGNVTKKEVSIGGNSSTKPSKTSLISAKSKKKNRIIVTWKKSKNADGYQLQYAVKKDFSKGKKTILIKNGKTVRYEIKKLKSKKSYYIRIRSYKTVKNTKKYSAWSARKVVKVK